MFSQKAGNGFISVSLIGLTDVMWYTKAIYTVIVVLTVLCGVLTLALQDSDSPLWKKARRGFSITLSVTGCLIFIITSQIYAAIFSFLFMLIKGILLIKRQ